MASLKEIKRRIASVRSTLKITSAMKLVSSARLHSTQSAIEKLFPYDEELHQILRRLVAGSVAVDKRLTQPSDSAQKVAILAFSSNTSLCGGFNANVIRETKTRIAELEAEGEQIEVFSVGRKMSDAMRKLGYGSPEDYSYLLTHPSYREAADFASRLTKAFISGQYKRIEVIFTHFVSTSTQKVSRSIYLPIDTASLASGGSSASFRDFILEPDAESLLKSLIPRALALRIYTIILDSSASEHAARMVAMQTASDNGEKMLQDLSLEYNKSRQKKITFEILDLMSGLTR
ncbi:MAG: ATP synthase F1 subunit gamma [Bacteroidales bacterium]|nr:ATP synthase F1 subunit gamma [Bacteroidales bacterium]